jgi:hypothetical protein
MPVMRKYGNRTLAFSVHSSIALDVFSLVEIFFFSKELWIILDCFQRSFIVVWFWFRLLLVVHRLYLWYVESNI